MKNAFHFTGSGYGMPITIIHICRLVTILLFSYGLLATASAATYYIDYQTGIDSNAGTSTSSPWKLCPGMVGFSGTYSHSNGDVFVFKGGVTWPYVSGGSILDVQNSGASGTEDKYTSDKTWFTGATWSYPILDGTAPSATIHGINLSDKSNVIIEYFKLIRIGHATQGSGNAICCTGGSNITIRLNYVSPNSVNAIQYGSDGTSSNIYIHSNIIRQCGRLYINAADFRLSNVEIHDNIMEGGWDYGPSPGYHTDGFMIEGDGVADYAIKNLKIYNNTFWGDWQKGATAAIYLTGTLAGDLKSTQHTYVYNNIITCSNIAGAGGSALAGIIAKYGHDDLRIYNNVIDFRTMTVPPSFGIIYYGNVSNVDTRNNIVAGVDNAIGYGTIPGTHIIDNCILATSAGNHLIYATSASLRWDTIAQCKAAGWLTSFGSSANPVFLSDPVGANNDSPGYGLSNGNWHVKSNSPARSQGANLGDYYTADKDGKPRPGSAAWNAWRARNPTITWIPNNAKPSNLSWTIGPYEYDSGLVNTGPSSVLSNTNIQ